MISDSRFARWLVVINGAIPAILLGWDAYHSRLGANPSSRAIFTTGMTALIFLTLSLTITPLRRLTGWDWLLGPRRPLGLYAFFYASLHFLIFFGYQQSWDVSQTLSELLRRKYLIVGMIGLLSMLPLAITSTNGMVKRLGASRWQSLHRLAYLAAIAGVLHFYMLVKADVRYPIAFAIVLFLLLSYRLIHLYFSLKSQLRTAKASSGDEPASRINPPRFWSGKLRVAKIFQETPNVRTFRLMSMDRDALPFHYLPGQYLNVSRQINGKVVRRSYTIASSPTVNSYCELTVKHEAKGLFSKHLHEQVNEGDELDISAPAGRFTFNGSEATGIVLIGGGVGITPLMSVVRYLTDTSWPEPIHLIYCSRSESELIFRSELEELVTRFTNLHVTLTLTGDRPAQWQGAIGRINAAMIRKAVPDIARHRVHLCGPTEMMAPMTKSLLELGVSAEQIKSEAFTYPSGTANHQDMPTPSSDEVSAPEMVSKSLSTKLTFHPSGKSITAPSTRTVLESAEQAGVDIPYECRSGVCGTCKVKLASGRVKMDADDPLTDQERAGGIILACQSHPLTDVIVQSL